MFSEAFAAGARENRALLITYLCAGDPSPQATAELLSAVADGGADILEVGMPFSDPTADGPVIQASSERALSAGMTMAHLFEAIRTFRRSHAQPVVIYSYYNPIMAFGEQAWVDTALEAGANGVLVVDLPPEEDEPLFRVAAAAGLRAVPLLAPTSTDTRIAAAAALDPAFLYYVSMTGITGAAAKNLTGAAERAAHIAKSTGCPTALGFGLKAPEDITSVAPHVDAAVVGSALVRTVAEAKDVHAACRALTPQVAALRAATVRQGAVRRGAVR